MICLATSDLSGNRESEERRIKNRRSTLLSVGGTKRKAGARQNKKGEAGGGVRARLVEIGWYGMTLLA